jgi:uncharacterized membrane protein
LRIKIGDGLLPLNILVVLLIVVFILAPFSVWRIVLGLPLVLFTPGYALMLAIFPIRGRLGGIERVALSVGMSAVVVALLMLLLNFTPWGFTEESTLYTIAAFIFIASLVALVRRKRLSSEEKFGIELQLGLPGWGGDV